jgi:hypothetical protein
MSERLNNVVRDYINKFGYWETQRMMGISYTKLAKLSGMLISEDWAYEIIQENINKNRLPTKYKEFRIATNFDGIVYWETNIKTGYFPSYLIESMTVYATPFWDANNYTPVDVDFYELVDKDKDVYVQITGDGDFFKTYRDRSLFNNVDDLFEWYKEKYLPNVYDIIMNILLPEVQKAADEELDDLSDEGKLRENTIIESSDEKFIKTVQDSINKNDLLTTIKIFGAKKVLSKILELNIGIKDKINFIRYVVKDVGGVSLFDIDETPIEYMKKGDEYHEIVYLGTNFVYIDVWNYKKYDGEYEVHYHNLNDDMINEIFWIVKSIAIQNDVF